MKKILLDTSFLIDIIKFKVRLEEIKNLINGEYKIFVPSTVVDELKSNPTKYAKIALKLIENVEILKTPERSADRAIINLTNKNILVATNDRKLRAKLKELRIRTIYLRAKKYLEMG
ncbi:MAG: PIN domain-containing protein [Candidatus Aenigmarchaeota archaeon]|nr:PIN domain-containing protein [Candidatus Aenigmarchaeota archaeon]